MPLTPEQFEKLGLTPLDGSLIKKMLDKAGRLISCSFHVCTVRSKSTGDWQNVLIFHDQDREEFSYAFSLNRQQSFGLIGLLMQGVETIEKVEALAP